MRSSNLIIFAIFFLTVESCISKCDISCPVDCVPVRFQIYQETTNVLTVANQETVSITPMSTDSPPSAPLMTLSTTDFSVIVCKGYEYILTLNDSTDILIQPEINVLEKDDCCTRYTVSAMQFNTDTVCSSAETCTRTVVFTMK